MCESLTNRFFCLNLGLKQLGFLYIYVRKDTFKGHHTVWKRAFNSLPNVNYFMRKTNIFTMLDFQSISVDVKRLKKTLRVTWKAQCFNFIYRLFRDLSSSNKSGDTCPRHWSGARSHGQRTQRLVMNNKIIIMTTFLFQPISIPLQRFNTVCFTCSFSSCDVSSNHPKHTDIFYTRLH